MDYTTKSINNKLMSERYEDGRKKSDAEARFFSSPAVSLTNYKKVVDKLENCPDFKPKYYGLSYMDFHEVQYKLINQRNFLRNNHLYDNISKQSISLDQIVMSANHNPNRYYAQIQNRINTLTEEAKEKNLEPVFITLTLPSEFHKQKFNKYTKQLEDNPKYNDTTPKDAVKVLTKMFAKLRQDRSLKELTKDERIYFRVNEPHKDGTPHTHILLFIPKERIERTVKAFNRLFNPKTNKIETNINNSTAYIMKYINKTLPLSKQQNLTQKDQYMNAWYSKNRIIRFNSSRTLAPLNIYRLLHSRFTLKTLTRLIKNDELTIFVSTLNPNKILEIFDGDELIYSNNINLEVKKA